MNLFSTGGTELANQDSFARANPLKADDLKAGFFEGIPTAAAMGAGAAINNYARPMADAAKGIDSMFKTDMSGWLAKDQEKAQQASRDLTPNPATVGWLGQQVYGATNMIGSVAIGSLVTGNPLTGTAVGAAAMGNAAFNQAREDGLDVKTSVGMGGITAGSTFLGAFIPVTATSSMATGLLGRAMGAEVAGNAATAAALYTAAGVTATIATNVPAKIAAAGALNTAVGIPTRGATSILLEANGYPEMAKQYEAFSMSEMISDFAVGSIFGLGLHGYQKWEQANQNKIPPAQMSDLDAALSLRNAAHTELGTAPGIPTDPETRQAHVDAINKAIEDLSAGRPVDVGNTVTEGNFMEDPLAVQTRTEIVRVVEDHMGPEWEGLQADLAARGMPTDTNLYQITRTPPEQMLQVRPTMEVNRIIERGKAEGWDTERMITELETLKGKLEQRNEAQLEARTGDRVRGELWVRERLLRAERNGELPPEAVRLANWLIDQNPNLVADIGLSFKKSGEVQGEAGGYNPLARIVTLIKGRANDETVIHEILHHAERMMPEAVQAGVRAEWFKELRAVTQMATRTQNQTLMKAADDALRAANGDERAFRNLAEMIANGEVDERFYALANPSEFWAVNGSRILRERANEGWVQQAKQWLAEFVEKIKGAFGLRSDAAVIRGLDGVLKSDGAFVSASMLDDGNVPRMRDIGSNFKRWFGKSKVVDAQGNPLVMYHGTDADFATFRAKDGMIFVTADPRFAEEYTTTTINSLDKTGGQPNIMAVYVKAENPFDFDNPEHIAALEQYEKDNRYTERSVSNYVRDIKRGDYEAIESRKVQAAIKAMGHDGFYVREAGRQIKNLGVFDPAQLKSATGNNGEFNPNDPNILRQITRDSVENPGRDTAPENLNGFEPDLRVRVPMGKIELPAKPLVLTGTNKKNAARQLAGIDEALAKFPDADTSPLEWSKMMAYAMATNDVPVPPYRFLKDINSDGAFRSLSRLSAGQIADAKHGFENAQAFRDAYVNKELDVETTGKLFMWSFLSRGVSPYTQEGLFIDGFKGAGEWIKKAADGNLTEADFPAYEAWAKSVAPQGSGQPGSGATHNLNAFGKLFLFKMGQKDENGVSLLQKMHTLMEDPEITGQQIRRWFVENTEGVGIDNKVVSFTLLVAGFKDLMVLDRVQIRQLWDDGRFGDRNLYDGRKVDGKPVAGSALSEITYGARGLLIYEAIERALEKRIVNLYTALGRPEDGSVGRYHWETWVADSQQEASHGTLDAILMDAKGNTEMISQVTAKEGEYGAYAYGARYGRDADGQPYFMYGLNGGTEYRFTVGAFREFLDAVKLPKNGVVPTKFKVTEAGNAPWYERPEVNRQALDELAQQYAGEPGAREGAGAVPEDGAGQAVPDGAGRGAAAADPYSAETVIINNPALTIIGADGNMVSAGRALTAADAEIATAKQESQGYDAAVACALRG